MSPLLLPPFLLAPSSLFCFGRAGALALSSTKPTTEEVKGWSQSFDKLMKNPAGRNVFREFLRTEYSEENMLFWLACEELKSECSKHTIEEKARMIYEDYISILSPKEVRRSAHPKGGLAGCSARAELGGSEPLETAIPRIPREGGRAPGPPLTTGRDVETAKAAIWASVGHNVASWVLVETAPADAEKKIGEGMQFWPLLEI